MFQVNSIIGKMVMDTIDAWCNSICGEKYYQVFANKYFFIEVYPIDKKYDCYELLDNFIKQHSVPDCTLNSNV